MATITGTTGVDTATYALGAISWNGNAWQVTSGTDVDTLHDIEHVVIDGQRYWLVDTTADGGFGSVQSAVNAASADAGINDTVLLATGSYAEQVLVNGAGSNGLTIEAAAGAGDVSIKAPNTGPLTTNGIIDPISNKDINAVVAVVGADDVTIRGITVDGDGRAALAVEGLGAGQKDFVGIAFINTDDGLVDHVTVTGVRYASYNGVQEGQAVLVSNTLAAPRRPTASRSSTRRSKIFKRRASSLVTPSPTSTTTTSPGKARPQSSPKMGSSSAAIRPARSRTMLSAASAIRPAPSRPPVSSSSAALACRSLGIPTTAPPRMTRAST